jgi:dihydroorotate dehydrogenase (NAD+) catalytic subunit
VNPLAVTVAGVAFPSPLVLASGVMGLSASSLKRVADAGAGAVTTKSCGLEERKGHPCPSILPFEHGLLNAVGLANPGVEEMAREIAEFQARSPIPVIASIFGRTEAEFGEAAARLLALVRPALLEINVSCPNVSSEFGQPFAADAAACARITSLVKARADGVPVAVKLSLMCPSIAQTAKACAAAGADAITAINSVGPGMLIDPHVRRPILANQVGGLSGGAILPLAVRAVWEIARAVPLPIIGTGGVTRPEDALQLILAGATAVGIGTGIYTCGLEVFGRINAFLTDWLAREGLRSLDALRGAAHHPPPAEARHG